MKGKAKKKGREESNAPSTLDNVISTYQKNYVEWSLQVLLFDRT